MKFFIGITLIAVFAAGAVHAAVSELEPSKQGVQQGNAAENLESLRIRKAARSYGAPAPSYGAPAPSYGAPAPAPSSSYGSAAPSIPAPPCPKNYLFSCQPHLAPVACAPPASGYQGSYSHQIAQWAANPQLEN